MSDARDLAAILVQRLRELRDGWVPGSVSFPLP
jgi:hypothetical protein